MEDKDLNFTIKDFGAIYEEYIDYKDHGLVADMWIEELDIVKENRSEHGNRLRLKKDRH